MDFITYLTKSAFKWIPYLNKAPNINDTPKPTHYYPTPMGRNMRRNIEFPSKRVVINKRDTNLFNNATFFILLQLMILIYVPAASLLAPYYENERDLTHIGDHNSNNQYSQEFIQLSKEMELFNPLRSKIVDNYTLFPRFLHGMH